MTIMNRAPLTACVFITVALMITAHALPRWYSRNIGPFTAQLGLWRTCAVFHTDAIDGPVCRSIDGVIGNGLDDAFKSARAFAIIAIIMIIIGAITSLLVEVEGIGARYHPLMYAPRCILGISAIAMMIAVLSFYATIKHNLLFPPVGYYDASFYIACSSVAMGLVSAVFAHCHHSRKPDENTGLIFTEYQLHRDQQQL